MKTLKKYSILSILSLCICAACTEDIGMEQISQSKGLLKVFAYIGEASTAQTKAGGEGEETTPSENTGNKDTYGVAMDEYYSYKATNNGGGFVAGCKIGMYSRRSIDGKDDENLLVNEPLKFVKESTSSSYRIAGFQSENIEIESMTNLGETFVYYPYSENNLKVNTTTGTKLKYQIDLYVSDNNNPYNDNKNKNEVIDLLIATNSGSLNTSLGVILYNFKHACSMLMIERGEGFENSTNDNVIVKIKNKLQAYVYSESSNFSLELEQTKETSIPSEFPTNVYTMTEGKKIYSVILPPEAEVEYIQMEDNFGTMQYIRPENGMKLVSGWKYPVTVKMNGFTPTIYPHEIMAWEDKVITIEKPAGIYDIAGFTEWITAYNGDETNGDETNGDETLNKYGTKVDGGSQWTFHLYADIDLKSYTGSFITTFSDKLEAHGHTISNIALQKTADGNVGFVGNLNGGSINNLKIDGISFNSAEQNINVGTVAGTVTSGSITNCKITGIDIESEYGYVGALAGSITAGTIETCLLEGELRLGKYAINKDDDNSHKLFGNISDDFTIEKDQINTSGVFVFQSEVGPGTGDTNTGDEGSDTGDNTGNDTEGGN